MLVITRTPGTVFYIGKDIKIVIVEVKGKNVRIGIEAPKDVSIVREENYGKTPKSGTTSKNSKRTSEG